MRVCVNCRTAQRDGDWLCPGCGTEPPVIDGFRALAPTVAAGGVGFHESYFAELASLEDANFWFRARNRLILWAVATYFPKAGSILEVGCGTGYVLHGMAAAMPSALLTGTELSVAGLGFAAGRVPTADFYQMDATAIPFWAHFDLVGAFDVLEHIPDDQRVLREMASALIPGGGMLLTVPQHPALWSPQDVLADHVRRYTATDIKRKLTAAGLEVVRVTSFTSLLLPMLLISRIHKRAAREVEAVDVMSELRLPRALNAAFEATMTLERSLIRLGYSFPAGGSLLIAARKPLRTGEAR
jgi:SAM-dependent methyltransferase